MFTIELAFASGCALACGFILSLILARVGQVIWAWVDDGKVPERNWIFHAILSKCFGCTLNDSYMWKYRRRNGGGTDGGEYLFITTLVLLSLPFLVLFAINNVAISLIFALSMASLFALRFTRRLSKKFGVHVKDNNAHKGE